MTRRNRRHFESQLKRDRARAKRVLDSAAPTDADRSTVDRADIATIANEERMGQFIDSFESAAVEEIDAALALIESAPREYGRCTACGRKIPTARLELLPTTRYCAAHAPNR